LEDLNDLFGGGTLTSDTGADFGADDKYLTAGQVVKLPGLQQQVRDELPVRRSGKEEGEELEVFSRGPIIGVPKRLA
jgi:hypothetical protein